MGLIDRVTKKAKIYRMRVRYFWLDTPSGAAAKVALCCLGLLALVVQVVRITVAGLMPQPAGLSGEPVKAAVAWWVIQIIILIVSAAISYAMRPRTEKPKPVAGEAPTVEDGQSIKHHFGTVWVEDEFLLAWKVTGTTPVKTKGGKK